LIECSWKSSFGIDCLTCGFQRSLEALLQGDFYNSFILFPATIPLLIVFLMLPIHLIFKLKHGAKIIVAFFSISAVLIVVNYSVKLSTNSLHSEKVATHEVCHAV